MSVSDVGIFRKQCVARPSATSILTSLLLSPRPSFSSSGLSSRSIISEEVDNSSRTGSSNPTVRTTPRKVCVSFATAQPNVSVSNRKSQIDNLSCNPSSERPYSIRQTIECPASPSGYEMKTIVDPANLEELSALGSVFDEFGGERRSPVIHDHYRTGQPKKLVDDCLKKERELRVIATTIEGEEVEDGEDDEYVSGPDDDLSIEEMEEEENNDVSNDEPDDNDAVTDGEPTNSMRRLTTRLELRLDLSSQQPLLSPHSVYTPSRDVVDNFVPGTLDEDQIEPVPSNISPVSLRDIDPTYPSEEDDETVLQTPAIQTSIISPVRFLPKQCIPIRLNPTESLILSKSRTTGLNRTLSLPWTQQHYDLSHQSRREPRNCASVRLKPHAISISKSIEHKRYSRREKKVHVEREISNGAEAMAAMVRQLMGKQVAGILTSSI